MSNSFFENVTFCASYFDDTTDFSGCCFKNVTFEYAYFEGIFNGAVFSDISFVDSKFEHSKINIGTVDDPNYLYGEEVRQWILNGGAK